MEKRESNYEIMKHRMQAQFAARDLGQVAGQWDLAREGNYLLLTFVGRPYRIDCTTGAVLWEQAGTLREADYNVSMTLFDMLTRSRQTAAGEVLPISAFSTLHSATVTGSGLFDRTARRFDHRGQALAAACRRLGGVPYGKGDVGYLLPVFRDLRAAVQFWDSDEEFGPELNLFCDRNILQFMHFETMMFMLIHILERLAEEMDDGLSGLEDPGQSQIRLGR